MKRKLKWYDWIGIIIWILYIVIVILTMTDKGTAFLRKAWNSIKNFFRTLVNGLQIGGVRQ